MKAAIQPRLFEQPTDGCYVSPYPDGLPGHHAAHPAPDQRLKAGVDALPAAPVPSSPCQSETEAHAAHEALGTASETTRRVWEFLLERGAEGATYTEVQQALGVGSAQQRLSDLVRRGLVADSGRRRQTPRHHPAVVWIADAPMKPLHTSAKSPTKGTSG